MSIVYDRWGVTVHHGDNLDVLRELPDASIDSIVTDPPAGIRFMGRAWDSDMGGRHQWVAWLAERMGEAHRTLKPGGHAVVWGLPRTEAPGEPGTAPAPADDHVHDLLDLLGGDAS